MPSSNSSRTSCSTPASVSTCRPASTTTPLADASAPRSPEDPKAMMKRFAILLSALPATMAVLPRTARAELPERVSPLADAPAVRHRAELREKRFEIGPSVTTTVGQDFYHAIMVGGRLSIHLTDWIAVSAMGAVNVTPNLSTSFNNTLTGGEPG